MVPTIIVGSIVALIFIAIIANEIYKKKAGKITSPCGKNCGACGLCRGQSKNSDEKNTD